MTLEEWANKYVAGEGCDYGEPFYGEAIEDFIACLRDKGYRVVKLHGSGQVSGGNKPAYALYEVTEELT